MSCESDPARCTLQLQAAQCARGSLIKLALAIAGQLVAKVPEPRFDIVGIHGSSMGLHAHETRAMLRNRSGEADQ